MPRATKNSSKTAADVNRSAAAGSNTAGKKGIPTIRYTRRPTHGSAGSGTGDAAPLLFQCSKCDNYAAKSKAGLSSHMRAKHPTTLKHPATPDPPARPPGDEAESLPPGTPPPALRTLDRSTSDRAGDGARLTGLLSRIVWLPAARHLRSAVSAFQSRGQKHVTFSPGVAGGCASAPALARDDTDADVSKIVELFQACGAENTKDDADGLAVRILESLSILPTHALVVGLVTKLQETNFDQLIMMCPAHSAETILRYLREDYRLSGTARRLFDGDDKTRANVGATNATLAAASASNTLVATPSKTKSGTRASGLKPFATPQPPARAPSKQGLHTVDRSNPSQDQSLVDRLSKVEGFLEEYEERMKVYETYMNDLNRGLVEQETHQNALAVRKELQAMETRTMAV